MQPRRPTNGGLRLKDEVLAARAGRGDPAALSLLLSRWRGPLVRFCRRITRHEEDARDVIRWEAQNHVPFDMESVELDFQILDPDGDGLQMNVLLVAAKRELVEGRQSLLAEAGLEPVVMDVDAFALHNAFEVNHPDAMTGVVGEHEQLPGGQRQRHHHRGAHHPALGPQADGQRDDPEAEDHGEHGERSHPGRLPPPPEGRCLTGAASGRSVDSYVGHGPPQG